MGGCGGNGVSLFDTSLASGGSPTIRDNAGYGVFCAVAPAVAHVTGTGYGAAGIIGNGLGASNCPPLGFPGRIP